MGMVHGKKYLAFIARIAGKLNEEADYESRHVNLDTEWQLDQKLLSSALIRLKFEPEINLFASRLNTFCKKYVAYRPDPGAIAIPFSASPL